ncbi:MAG: helix-turn-helix domain protein [Labilithrix sp.]|nr:helix-turn-helix domain protein [Labilithrix sp.]
MTCKCGGTTKAPAKHSFRRTVAGTTFTATADVDSCAGCGEVYIPASLMIAFERAIAGELARHGPVCDETFRWIRKAAGVERNELAFILGVSSETIAGWESERRPVDRAAWLLVAAMVLDGMDGPRALRTRLTAAPATRTATGSERVLELPPGGMIARLLTLLAGPSELTDADIADALDVDPVALKKQLRELAERGLVSAITVPTHDAERWSPFTRDRVTLLRAALDAGVDLDAPLPRALRGYRREPTPNTTAPAPMWR